MIANCWLVLSLEIVVALWFWCFQIGTHSKQSQTLTNQLSFRAESFFSFASCQNECASCRLSASWTGPGNLKSCRSAQTANRAVSHVNEKFKQNRHLLPGQKQFCLICFSNFSLCHLARCGVRWARCAKKIFKTLATVLSRRTRV